jgi:hypothetical protein
MVSSEASTPAVCAAKLPNEQAAACAKLIKLYLGRQSVLFLLVER